MERCYFTFMVVTITFLQKRETVLETDLNRIETALKLNMEDHHLFSITLKCLKDKALQAY